MKNIKNIINRTATFPIAFLMLLLTSCHQKKAEETHEEEEITKTEITLTEAQFKTVGIQFGKVEKRNLKTIIKANGYTTVPPQNSAKVATLLGGTVKDIFVLEGTFVNAGKLLANLQNLEVLEMLEDYKSAAANIEYLQLEYNRQKTLVDENVNPRKVFQEVEAKLAVEKAKAQAAKNKLHALNVSTNSNSAIIPIISPISGFVGKISTAKGEFAETGIPLFEVVDNRQMHLDLNVYEKDLASIAIGQEVDFILTNQSNKSIKGKIFGINKSFSNESKTVTVHARINPDDTKGLISGMYVSANINLSKATVPALPKGAVMKNGDRFFIYIKENPPPEKNEKHKQEEEKEIHFKAIEVIPGTTDMGYTEIKFVTSIPDNSQIVTQGTFYLLAAQRGGGVDADD